MVRQVIREEWRGGVTQEEVRLDHQGWITGTFQVLGRFPVCELGGLVRLPQSALKD